MNRNSPAEVSGQQLAEAASWRVRLSEANAETTLGFEQWMAQDPGNAVAWQSVEAPWQLLGEQATTPELLAVRLTALQHARKAARSRWRWRATSSQSAWRAAAAAALVVTISGLLWLGLFAPETYRTATGERRQVTLADGSQFSLDSESEVRVSYTSRSRELQVVRGQARFSVARDVRRPFTVVADEHKVVATGTEFNVDLLESDLFVTLLEGRVVVLPQETTPADGIELEAGEQVSFVGTLPASVRSVDVALATAWESGRLVFENEPLAAVAARVSRYSRQTVRIADARAAGLRISGVFAAGDVAGFLNTVTTYLPVRADAEAPEEIALRHR